MFDDDKILHWMSFMRITFFLLHTVCPVDRTPRCTFSTQKVLRRHLGLKLKGRDPVSLWGTWRTWWSRQRPRCRATVQTRTKTWLLKTLESGKPFTSVIPNCLSQYRVVWADRHDLSLLIQNVPNREEVREEIFKKGQSKRIWGELYKVLLQLTPW